MDAVGILKKEFLKVEAKHRELEEGLSNVDDLIAAIENNQVNVYLVCIICIYAETYLMQHQELDPTWYLSQVKTELTNISGTHKDWHGSISRFGKVIDKQLTENVSFISNK